MKIVYLITDEPDSTLQTIIKENKLNHTIKVINLKTNKDYDEIVDTIEDFDRVISW